MALKALGRLMETTQEELQSLAGAAGMPAVPTSPLGAAMIGAEPDSAKMAGTPPNKIAALRQSLQQGLTLETAQRLDEGTRQEATEEETQAIQQSEVLKGMGSLGQRFLDIAKQYQSQAAQEAVKTLMAQVDVSSFPEDKQAEATTLLQKIRDSDGQEVLDALAGLARLRGTEFGQGFDAATFASQFFKNLTPQELQQKLMNAMTDKTVEFKDIPNEALQLAGIAASREEIANALGVSVTALNDMKFSDIQRQFEKIQADNYTNVQELQQTMNDPSASMAERIEARRRLRELGIVKVRPAEEKVNDIVAQLEDGDTVNIGGREFPIDEILSNPTTQFIIDKALNDPEFLKKLEEEQPQFAEYIKENQQILTKLNNEVSPEVKEFNEIQTYNASLAGPLSVDVAREFIPEYGQILSTRITNVPDVITTMNAIKDPTKKNEFANLLTESTKYPELRDALKTMSAEEISRLGIANNPTQFLNNYKSFTTIQEQIKNADADGILDYLFGGDIEAYNLIKNNMTVDIDGDGTPEVDYGKQILKDFPILDMNNDGVVDDINTIKQNLLNKGNVQQLLQAAASGKNPFDKIKTDKIKQLRDAVKQKEDYAAGATELQSTLQNIDTKGFIDILDKIRHNVRLTPTQFEAKVQELENLIASYRKRGLDKHPDFQKLVNTKNYLDYGMSILRQHRNKPNIDWYREYRAFLGNRPETFEPEQIEHHKSNFQRLLKAVPEVQSHNTKRSLISYDALLDIYGEARHHRPYIDQKNIEAAVKVMSNLDRMKSYSYDDLKKSILNALLHGST